MTRAAVARSLAALGLVTLATSLAWWWIVYRPLLVSELLTLPRALPCMIARSDLCTLAEALCRADHTLGIRYYHAAGFWTGVAIVVAALIMPRRVGADRAA